MYAFKKHVKKDYLILIKIIIILFIRYTQCSSVNNIMYIYFNVIILSYIYLYISSTIVQLN